MTQAPRSFIGTIKSFPATFWVANTMEIFERLSWYGWYMLMPLYVTGSRETGGLGFSTETRGSIQAIVPFFLYLFPVLTGALADRYGYKKTFIAAYLIMIVSYYLLGQFYSVPLFFLAFMFVAIGAGIFKPVVVGTISRLTNESNVATGFGIFYMMVNIGGFLGPFITGIARGFSWKYVFITCSGWAFINLLIVLLFYKEPAVESASRQKKSLRQVLDGMVEVLGNVRFCTTVFIILAAMMLANSGLIQSFSTFRCYFVFIPGWLILNFFYDRFLPSHSGTPVSAGGTKRHPFMKRMYCSNWRFALYLLILSGFWTSFNQLYLVIPEYIRDFVDTRPVTNVLERVAPKGAISNLATINEEETKAISKQIETLMQQQSSGISSEAVRATCRELLASKIRIAPEQLQRMANEYMNDPTTVTTKVIQAGRQVNPEFIGDIDAFSIVMFQVLISFLTGRFHRFLTMIVGTLIAGGAWVIIAFAGGAGMVGPGASVWIVLGGLVILAIGEMMASPTSQEYVSRIAPKERAAVYMGYYFIAIALGNLFGGILSGQVYGKFARDMQRPDLMWLIFAGIFFLTAAAFIAYNKFALPKPSPREQLPAATTPA